MSYLPRYNTYDGNQSSPPPPPAPLSKTLGGDMHTHNIPKHRPATILLTILFLMCDGFFTVSNLRHACVIHVTLV